MGNEDAVCWYQSSSIWVLLRPKWLIFFAPVDFMQILPRQLGCDSSFDIPVGLVLHTLLFWSFWIQICCLIKFECISSARAFLHLAYCLFMLFFNLCHNVHGQWKNLGVQWSIVYVHKQWLRCNSMKFLQSRRWSRCLQVLGRSIVPCLFGWCFLLFMIVVFIFFSLLL